MKRVYALIVSIMIAVSAIAVMNITPVYGSDVESDTVILYRNRLEALGVVKGDTSYNDYITRAEFASVVAEMFYSDKEYVDVGQIFSDVPPEHPFYDDIARAYLTGALKGNGDGTFSPDDKVTYGDAAKIFLSLTGYSVVADENGGYPLGFWLVAGQKGILPNKVQIDENVSMSGLIYMSYKTLELPVMEVKYYGSNSVKAENNDHTLLNDLMNYKEIDNGRGILTSDGVTFIDGPNAEVENAVFIDGVEHKCDDIDTNSLLGQTVEFWYNTKSKGKNVFSLYPYYNKNSVYEYNTDDIENISINEVRIKNGSGTINKKLSSNLMVVYNNQGLSSFSINDLNIQNGKIKLVDNDGNGSADVLFLYEKESYIIDKVGNNGYSITYKMYDGQNESGFQIDENDTSVTYIVRNSDGMRIEPKNIGADSVISVYKSKTGDVITAVITKNVINGTAEVVRDNGAYVTILENEYEVAKNSMGNYLNLNINPGDVIQLYLDEDGRAVYASNSDSKSMLYAYIIDIAETGTFESNRLIKVAIAGNLSSISNSQYYWVRDKLVQNERLAELNVSSKCTLDELRYKGNELTAKLREYKNEVVSMEINTSGEISSIKKMIPLYEFENGEYNHNTQSVVQKDLSVDEYDNPAITLNGSVKGLVIPSTDDSERDSYTDSEYLSKYRIENGKKNHRIAVYEFVEDSQTPKLIALKEKLTESGTANAASDRGIITSPIGEGVNEDGGKIYYAEYFDQNGNQKSVKIRGDVSADKLWSMKTKIMDVSVGDIVEFSTDSAGEVMTFKVLSSSNDPIESNLVKVGKMIKFDGSAVWNENNEGFRNIYYFIQNNGTKQIQGIVVDNAIFKYYKSSKKVEKISGRDINVDVNLEYSDTVMIASNVAVIIAD